MSRYILPLILMILIGCSKQPNIDYDSHYDIATIERFAIVHTTSKDGSSLNDERISEAIMHEMQAKGYQKTEKPGADFHITFESRIKEDVPSNVSFGFGFGSFSSGVGTSIATSHRPTKDLGELHIDMIDPKTKKTFWRSVYTKDIKDFSTPQERTDYFNALISEMLKAFPPHTKVQKTQ